MRLSVLIPTRDRPAVLSDCLETLAGQQDPPGGMEILVIDDGSAQPVAEIAQSALAADPRVRCLRQPKGGLNVARNEGLREARGDLVAFLDDDTLVQQGWSTAIHEGFVAERCQVLGGRIRLDLETEIPRWLTHARLSYLSLYDLGSDPRAVTGPPLPFGANFAIDRGALAQLGAFREDLDRVGSSLVSNGETELLHRVLDAGGRIVYWPAAEVLHRVPAERLTKPWFARRAYAQGISDVRTDLDGRPHALRVGRELWRACRALPILARRMFELRGPFDARLWLLYCRGRLSELRRERRSGASV